MNGSDGGPFPLCFLLSPPSVLCTPLHPCPSYVPHCPLCAPLSPSSPLCTPVPPHPPYAPHWPLCLSLPPSLTVVCPHEGGNTGNGDAENGGTENGSDSTVHGEGSNEPVADWEEAFWDAARSHPKQQVLLDILHAMKRIRDTLPAQHTLRHRFMGRLRDLIFIIDDGDIQKQMQVLTTTSLRHVYPTAP